MPMNTLSQGITRLNIAIEQEITGKSDLACSSSAKSTWVDTLMLNISPKTFDNDIVVATPHL